MTPRFVLTAQHADSLRQTLTFEIAKKVGLIHAWAANELLERVADLSPEQAAAAAVDHYLPPLPPTTALACVNTPAGREVRLAPATTSGPLLARLFADHPRPGGTALATPVLARPDGTLGTYVTAGEHPEDAGAYLGQVRDVIATHLAETRESLTERTCASLDPTGLVPA